MTNKHFKITIKDPNEYNALDPLGFEPTLTPEEMDQEVKKQFDEQIDQIDEIIEAMNNE